MPAGGFVALALLVLSAGCAPKLSKTTYVVGYDEDPPYHYTKGGEAAGIAYEVLTEAAGREGLELKWVRKPEGLDEALKTGAVDLWPVAGDFAERHPYFYITEPWMRSQYYFMLPAKAAAKLPTGTFQGVVGHKSQSISEQILKRDYPRVRRAALPDWDALAEALCRGRVDAALVASSVMERITADRPGACRSASIEAVAVPGLVIRFGIGSTTGSRAAADRIRSQMDSLGEDGTLLAILAHYSFREAGEVQATFELLQERSRTRLYFYAAVLLALGMFAALGFNLKLQNAQIAALAAESEKADLLTRYTLAAAATNDAIWDWDARRDCVAWNEGLEMLFGYSPNEVNPSLKWHRERIHPDDRKLVEASLTAAIHSKARQWKEEYLFRKADGTYANVIDRAHIVYGKDGSLVRVIGAMIDLTTRLHLEERLQQAQKMEAVGRLAGGIAHDFNNLLTVINGYAQLALLKLERTNPLFAQLEEIKRAGERAAGLTSQLLTFSRKQPVTTRPIDLTMVVGEFDNMLRRLVGENIELRTSIAAKEAVIEGDKGLIGQILMNLVVNSRDAMPRGGRILISLKSETVTEASAERVGVSPGEYALLEVTDTGEGMDENVLRHLFEPFFTTKGKASATGLGLATVFGIVNQLGGGIEVESTPGKGASFKVYLPKITAAPVEEQSYMQLAGGLQGHETILVAEDQDEVRHYATQVLKSLGYRVIEARNGLDALEASRKQANHIDILLTDVVMPGMNGVELAEKLKSEKPGLRVVFTSGYPVTGSGHEGGIEPGAHFIPKPFSPEGLATIIRSVLDGKIRLDGGSSASQVAGKRRSI